MDIQYLRKKIADVKLNDYLSGFKYVGGLILKAIVGNRYKNCWLICEEPMEARDNGYWFYKYLCENTDVQCFYAIDRSSPDYSKIEKMGEIIPFGSVKHWLIYLSCKYNISSQKGGKPNAALCAFLELTDILKVNNVFLQHGVTISDAKWLYADRSRFTFFITATRPETDYIEKHFGYKNGVIQYTGFPRFDNLHRFNVKKNQILIMPSWRAWFYEKSAQIDSSDSDFLNSEYLKCWREILSSSVLDELIITYGLEVIFYPHRNMQQHLDCFRGINSKVKLASVNEYDVQNLLMSSELLITDYSSVFFDMVYMRKPVIFYQFDEVKFRKQQYQKGYFDYHNSRFGHFCRTCDEVMNYLKLCVKNKYKVSEEYMNEHRKVFEKYDNHNSERIYKLLMNN